MSETDEYYMSLAVEQAKIAAEQGEVPIGAVVVWDDGRVVGVGRNCREGQKNALGHAEIMAIDAACRELHGWRLHKATLYVTLEPCPMCAGAIVNSRVRRVVFGARDPKAGALGSKMQICDFGLNHSFEQCEGVMGDICADLLSNFFSKLRKGQRSSDISGENSK